VRWQVGLLSSPGAAPGGLLLPIAKTFYPLSSPGEPPGLSLPDGSPALSDAHSHV